MVNEGRLADETKRPHQPAGTKRLEVVEKRDKSRYLHQWADHGDDPKTSGNLRKSGKSHHQATGTEIEPGAAHNISGNQRKMKGEQTMKAAYPVVLMQEDKWTLVYIPDFEINTEGSDYADAMEMARDAIGLMGITLEDDGKELPAPSDLRKVAESNSKGDVTLVDVDFTEYRRANDMRTVRRNVSLPQWLNVQAEKAGINVSAVLQKALKAELNLR
jgi:predicted RNase H-like HicB family nuclease